MYVFSYDKLVHYLEADEKNLEVLQRLWQERHPRHAGGFGEKLSARGLQRLLEGCGHHRKPDANMTRSRTRRPLTCMTMLGASMPAMWASRPHFVSPKGEVQKSLITEAREIFG